MMEDFLKKYDEHRALADVDESLLQIRHPDLDVDQTDEFSQSLTQPAACSEASCALFNEVLQAWMPQSMKQNYGPSRQGAWEFQVDREDLPAGLAEQMDGLREKIDRVFGWAGKRLAQEWRQKRGATQARTGRQNRLHISCLLFAQPKIKFLGNSAAS